MDGTRKASGDPGYYCMMPPRTPDEIARAYYRRIYGGEPTRVIQTGGCTMVGPVPDEVAKARGQAAGR